MSALSLIYTCLELDAGSIHGLSEQEIVRIEKRLKADVRLNNNIDTNQLELVLTVLRKYYEEFKILHNPEYDRLREILFEPELFCIVKQCDVVKVSEDISITEFLSAFFLHDIRTYVQTCLKNGHYYGLHSLLLHSDVLPGMIKEEITKKCLFKIEYATECLGGDVLELEKKIAAQANPYFYRCLNCLGAAQFEDEIRTLSNTNVYSHRNSTYELFSRIMYAIGFFVPVDESLKKTLKKNQRYAFNEGVREFVYNLPELENKGSTYVTRGNNSSGGPEINTTKDLREFLGLLYKNFIKKK